MFNRLDNLFVLTKVVRIGEPLPDKYNPIIGQKFSFITFPEVGHRMHMLFYLNLDPEIDCEYEWSTRQLVDVDYTNMVFKTRKAIYYVENIRNENY